MLKLGIFFISFSLLAATNSTDLSRSVFQFDKKANSNFFGDVSFSANQLVGDVGEVVGNRFQADLTLGYSVPETADSMKKHVELRFRANDEKNVMYSVRQAYVQKDMYNGQVTIGRFALPWSKLDENWSLGKLNNRVNFDGFEPDQEGLVGAGYKYKNGKGFKVEAFASMLYVPELNPSTKIDKANGTITCENPWCDAPNSSTEISGKDTPIFYDVNMPDLGEIVFQYSTAVRLGYEYNNFDFSGFLARKPENSIATRVEISSPGGALTSLNAEITPEVYYHNLVGLEAKYELNEHVRFNISSLVIRPDDNPVENPEDFEFLGLEPKKINEDYIGGGVDYRNGRLTGALNYIARVSEFDKEGDPLVQYPRWNQAVHFNLGSQVTRKVRLGLDYKYDMLTEDRLTMFRADYAVSPSFLTSFGVNMIGTASDGESYWSKFTNNDSVYGSMKYRF